MKILVVCNRCQRTVDGLIEEGYTAGYYNVSPGAAWHKYARPGEFILCEPCMWADPAFKKVYPHVL